MLVVALLTLTACGNSKEATEQSITLESREAALESREKVLESKESEVTDQSKTIESKEKSLDSREKAVATKESEQKVIEEETAPEEEAPEDQIEPQNGQQTTDAPTDAEATEIQKQYEKENTPQSKSIVDDNNGDESDFTEVIDYYNTKKEETIARKKEQVYGWKENNEINWTDESISSGLVNFESKFLDAGNYTSYLYGKEKTVEEIKGNIDKDFNDIFVVYMNK